MYDLSDKLNLLDCLSYVEKLNTLWLQFNGINPYRKGALYIAYSTVR